MYKKEELVTRLQFNRKAACVAEMSVHNYEIRRFQNSCIFVFRNFVVSKQQIFFHTALTVVICVACAMPVCLSVCVCVCVIWDET